MKAIYPGSFDPITNGHLNIIRRAAKVFDEVVIVVMINPEKSNFTFTKEERMQMISDAIVNIENVTVSTSNKLAVVAAKNHGAGVIVRGIRAVMDYEKELQNATANLRLDQEVETIFFISEPEYSFISSTSVKEIAMFHGDISSFVPPLVNSALQSKAKLHLL